MSPAKNELPNEQQRKHLSRLLEHMEGLPDDYDQFGMNEFSSGSLTPCEVAENDCQTILCLAGHGPLVGIGDAETVRRIGWPSYVQIYLCPRGAVFSWLFHAGWSERDNTLAGAIKRLRYFLNVGVPENSSDIMYGEAPYPWEF